MLSAALQCNDSAAADGERERERARERWICGDMNGSQVFFFLPLSISLREERWIECETQRSDSFLPLTLTPSAVIMLYVADSVCVCVRGGGSRMTVLHTLEFERRQT